MKCSNCKDNSLYLNRIIGKDGYKNLCSACIVMDDTEFKKDNPYTFLRNTLREKHRTEGK